MANSIQKFLLNNLDVRGVIVHLDTAWQEVLHRRKYNTTIAELLGQATAATLLIGSNIKFAGQLLLQLQSRGDLPLMVVQSDNRCHFRALAQFIGTTPRPLKQMTVDGLIMIAVESQIGKKPYQGMVDIHSNQLSDNIESYFNRSEQLPTILVLRADTRQAAGILLQVLPDTKISDDDWHRLRYLAQTLNLAELKTTDTQTIIKRIFAEEDKIVYTKKSAAFSCSCSDERTLAMLASLDEKELGEIVADGESVVVGCDFCGKQYQHDAATIAALLSNKIHPN